MKLTEKELKEFIKSEKETNRKPDRNTYTYCPGSSFHGNAPEVGLVYQQVDKYYIITKVLGHAGYVSSGSCFDVLTRNPTPELQEIIENDGMIERYMNLVEEQRKNEELLLEHHDEIYLRLLEVLADFESREKRVERIVELQKELEEWEAYRREE